jgi:hypothetical protein
MNPSLPGSDRLALPDRLKIGSGRHPSRFFRNRILVQKWRQASGSNGGGVGRGEEVVKKIRAVMRFRVFLLSFLFLACMAQTAAAADGETKGALDGEVFLVEKGEAGKPSGRKDTYIFRDGKFRSTYCEKHYGFGEGAYSSTKKGNTITFAADTRSESHGTIHWEGTVKVGEIDVRYAWASRKGNPKPKEHWARSVTEWGMKDPGPPGGGAVSHLLDGKIYYVKTGEEGKGPDHDDYLIFQDGMFTSSGCVGSWNFRNASYSATAERDGIRFLAQVVSPTHGAMTWEGTVRGDVMDATARWVHEKWYWTIDRIYWFRGKLLE